MWHHHKKKEVIEKLKILCCVSEEKEFDEKLKDFEKILNDRGKEWLKVEMLDKSKWALAFNEGGKRYGIMNTNNSESLNNVFKGIRSRPVAGIIEYSFQKYNEYFVDRLNKASSALETGLVLGKIAQKYIEAAELRSVNQIGIAFGPERMIYSIRGAGGTNIGGESHGGRNYKVDLKTGECTCMLPQLLHMSCLLDPGTRDCTRGTLLLGYGMGHGPRPTSVVTTRDAVGLLVQ
jgi:hypothetical protein